MEFKDKVVVVVGGAAGIGRECVRLFSEHGAIVMVADRDASGTKEIVDSLTSQGRKAEGFVLDVSDMSSVTALYKKVDELFGRLDVVVNAASILVLKNICDTSVEEWNRVININLTGTFLSCKTAISYMKENHGGNIVNFSSSTGNYDACKDSVAYIASKGGVTLLTKALAIDHAMDNIRVNAVAPGPTDTAMIRKEMDETRRAAFARTLPVQRLAKPEEIARTILFLASDDASFVTGAVLAVDGGQTAEVS